MGKTNKTVPAVYLTPDGCIAIAETLSRIGDKWTVLVIASLSSGEPKRYSELRRKLEGISQRMLTLTLKGLEQDGLATRTMYPTIPPRVDYVLTPLGQKLLGRNPSFGKVTSGTPPDPEPVRDARCGACL